MAKPEEGGQDETDSPAPPEGEKESGKPEDEVREHVVDFLSCQGKLSGLQKQVCVLAIMCERVYASTVLCRHLYMNMDVLG